MARWPEFAYLTTISVCLKRSPVLRSELAIKTRIRLAEEAGCAQLFKCPVSAIHHGDDGITVETADGDYHAKKQ